MSRIQEIEDEIIDLEIMLLGADEEERVYILDRIKQLEEEKLA